jgi:dihydrofolate reductase
MVTNKSGLRKLKLHVQMSIDGCIAGPNGEMDWMVGLLDDKLIKYEKKLMESFDTILLGRKMTDLFISYWSDVISKPDDPWYEFAKKNDRNPKSCIHQNIEQIKVDKYRLSNR